MTAEELQNCLTAIRWPASTLAETLGRDEDEIYAWLADASPIPAKTAAWVKVLADYHQAAETIKPGR